MSLRDTCIDLLFSQCPLFISRDQFGETLIGWDIEPILNAHGEVGAAFISKDADFHFGKFDTSITATRAHLKKYPGEIIKRYGYATTSTPKDDIRQQRFNERLGFFRVGETEFDIIYKIENLRAKRNSICQ